MMVTHTLMVDIRGPRAKEQPVWTQLQVHAPRPGCKIVVIVGDRTQVDHDIALWLTQAAEWAHIELQATTPAALDEWSNALTVPYGVAVMPR